MLELFVGLFIHYIGIFFFQFGFVHCDLLLQCWNVSLTWLLEEFSGKQTKVVLKCFSPKRTVHHWGPTNMCRTFLSSWNICKPFQICYILHFLHPCLLLCLCWSIVTVTNWQAVKLSKTNSRMLLFYQLLFSRSRITFDFQGTGYFWVRGEDMATCICWTTNLSVRNINFYLFVIIHRKS